MTVPGLVQRIAADRPGDIAVQDDHGSVAYGELIQRAEVIARRLQVMDVTPGERVALCAERSVGLVVAALGIFMAGAAYVCLDPSYPQERTEWMLADSEAAALVTDRGAPDRSTLRITPLGEPADGVAATVSTPLPDVSPNDVAYVVYTSGSTGQPKGVMVEHAGLLNLTAWHLDAFGLTAADCCSQIASPGFDASVWEIWPPLSAGASLRVVPEPLRRDPLGLRDWLTAAGVTVGFLPTALAEAVISLSWPSETKLRYLLTGGDALTRRPPAQLPFTLVNNYGLSETTVVSTSGTVDSAGAGLPTIGRAITGVALEVVDEELNPVAPGEAGELVIGGVSVGRGYLGRPELTAERFVAGPDGRRYRTGDVVRLRCDGEIEFLGRRDEQLSIRGYRIEPGEVVAALNGHPAVATSVAVGVGESSGDRRLVAYLVPTGSERPATTELDAFMADHAPAHLIPSSYVWLDALPFTANGKVDRAALPAPDQRPEGRGRQPRSETERITVAAMCDLLEVPHIGMDENFFLLGGHSMLGGQLIVRLGDLFDVEISLRFLFDHPTAAAIAAEVDHQRQLDGLAKS